LGAICTANLPDARYDLVFHLTERYP
jgi:hypothetical protein